jgi:hypothetical protein
MVAIRRMMIRVIKPRESIDLVEIPWFAVKKCVQQEHVFSTDLEHCFGSSVDDALSSLLHLVKETHLVNLFSEMKWIVV